MLHTFLRKSFDQLGPLLAMFAVWCLFAVLRWQHFASWENSQSILLQTAVVGIAALGATMIIVAGGIDLSVGSLIALTSVIVAYALEHLAGHEGKAAGALSPGFAAALSAVLGIAAAGVCGLGVGAMIVGRIGRVAAVLLGSLAALLAWQHFGLSPWAAAPLGVALATALWFAEARLKLSLPLLPFIVTLGAWGAFRGVAKGIANNSAIYPRETWLNALMRLPTTKADMALLFHPTQWWSPGVWIFLVLAAVIAGLLRYTQFGRHVYAIGSNEQTARLCGVDVAGTKIKIYTLAAILAGVAGVLQYSQLTMGDPTTANGYELKVIASVVIGGASLSGGVGTVLGTLAGALMMTIIDNGCTKVGVANWIQEIITGAIIVAAVAVDQLRHRAKS